MSKVRWGVAGTGAIAEQFLAGLAQVPAAEVVAVASRTRARSEAFGSAHEIPHRHASYESLAQDADVDVVYVATPNSRHAADTLLYLDAGKAVLCEKPFACTATEAEEMAQRARHRGLFLMEAMWSRFLPAYRTLREILAEGTIGSPLLVEADLGFRMPFDAGSRLFRPELGGGALLDLGVYPLNLCSMVFGPPASVQAAGHVGPTGVDEIAVATLQHAGGGIGLVKAAIRANLACTGRITGASGSIDIPAFVHAPDHLVVNGRRIDCGYEGEGLRFEAVEVHRCLGEGLTQSETMPVAESVEVMRTLDTLRQAVETSAAG